MRLQFVFFDMGGTIDTHTHDSAGGLRATSRIRELLAGAGVEMLMGDEDLYDLINRGQKEYRMWRERTYVELPPERVWTEFVLKDQHPPPGRIDPVAERMAYIVETRFYRRFLRPEAPQVLRRLRALGLGMGIISNIQSRGQVPDDLQRYRIRELFHPVVLSCEFGRRKPDPAIFRHTAGLAGVPASRCAYVGDRISRDILGAKRAGFALAVQIRHDFVESEELEEPRPDALIDNMAELPSVLMEH